MSFHMDFASVHQIRSVIDSLDDALTSLTHLREDPGADHLTHEGHKALRETNVDVRTARESLQSLLEDTIHTP